MPDFLIKFRFLSPLRIGCEEIDLQGLADGLHSDTLFSALCHTFAELYGSAWLADWLEQYKSEPSFIISSAFPFFQDRCYLPKPFLPAPETIGVEQDHKLFKNLQWLNPRSLLQWLKNEPMALEQLQKDKTEMEGNWQEFTMPRVSLDRVTNASNIFYCSQRVFYPERGLYCLLRLTQPSFKAVLEGALEYLGECGLGSERNNGYGRFNVRWEEPDKDFQELLSQQGSRYYLLGLYHPQDSTEDFRDAQYALLQRKGWFYSSTSGKQFKRRSVWMFKEGSVLTKKPMGRLVDVTPSICGSDHHPIYRYGMAPSLQF